MLVSLFSVFASSMFYSVQFISFLTKKEKSRFFHSVFYPFVSVIALGCLESPCTLLHHILESECGIDVFCFLSETGAGVIQCIEKALAQSGVCKEDVNYINAHATSTPAGDLKEYKALIHCFGKNPEVTSIYKHLPFSIIIGI